MKIVRVKLKSRLNESYNIRIGEGALELLPESIRKCGKRDRIGLVIDANAARFHGPKVEALLDGADLNRVKYEQPSGEEHKTRAAKEKIEESFFKAGLGRGSLIVAVGGGVTGDIAGFTAATFMRGIPVIQVPTTLLSQVDSSVGGKTGVDTPAGKNMVGSFHQPAAVIIDPAFLLTLEDDEFLSGLGEVIKHALLFDPSLYRLLMEHKSKVLARELGLMADIVARNCALKAAVVRRDCREAEYRKTLNLGHTFAHALESVTDFRVKHGIAVLHGLCAEICIGVASGLVVRSVADRVFSLVENYLPKERRWESYDIPALVRAMAFDKKNSGSAIFFSLIGQVGKPLRIGRCYALPVSVPVIEKGISAFASRLLH